MRTRSICLALLIPSMILLSGRQHHHSRTVGGNSFVIIGESMTKVAEAAQELQLAINRTQTIGCTKVSVEGYGAAGEGRGRPCCTDQSALRLSI